jgi:hypothetical protein
MIVSVLFFAVVAERAWKAVRRNASWKPLAGWSAIAILVYAGFIALISGPEGKVLDSLSADASMALITALALPPLLFLCQLGFQAIDGPFPKLPVGVVPVNIDRRRLYPWMAASAGVVTLMAGALRVGPASWHDNLFIATWLTGTFACMVLWFLHYKARRFDYGRTSLQSSFWFHWVYTTGELEWWQGLPTGAGSETWMGPGGLLFGGEYAPWDMFVYRLVRVAVRAHPSPRPDSLDFTFKATSFGNYTSEEVMHVPIPDGHSSDLEVLEKKLRDLCPDTEIHLVS